MLVEGALEAAGVDRASLTQLPTLLDTCVLAPSGASAVRACISIPRPERSNASKCASRPAIRSTRSCCGRTSLGAAHMALGWVCTESLSVDPETGVVHDLTIRSFGIVRPKDMPPVEVVLVDDDREPLAGASDAAFAAVAAAVWNALTRVEGTRPDTFPARQTRTARLLRR